MPRAARCRGRARSSAGTRRRARTSPRLAGSHPANASACMPRCRRNSAPQPLIELALRARLRDLPAAHHQHARAPHALRAIERARHASTTSACTNPRATNGSARDSSTRFSCRRSASTVAARGSGTARVSTIAPSPSGSCASTGAGPRLVGLAYSFQVVPHVPVTATDVFMDIIVTERGIDELLAHEDRAVDLRSR